MKNDIKIVDEEMLGGSFVLFSLDNVSYYPTEKIASNIALNLYGVDLLKKGLHDSEKYREEKRKGVSSIDLTRPMGHCDVDGEFVLFLLAGKSAWGLMDIRGVLSSRPDINLSIISSAALMPHKLQLESGAVCKRHALFNAIDRDGSRWTLHCK